jgi:deoxyribodipyrimidine photo-lyase
MVDSPISIFWFRRDLRLHDNAALYKALSSNAPVQPIFIFDTSILNKLEDKDDARLNFIYQTTCSLNEQLNAYGSRLLVEVGEPAEVFERLLSRYSITSVYANTDYEPYALQRDEQVASLLQKNGISFSTFKDHVIFEKREVLSGKGEPYTVFTPYSKRWKLLLAEQGLPAYPSEKNLGNLLKSKGAGHIPDLHELGFDETNIPLPASEVNLDILKEYARQRDYPGVEGTSRLGIHLRFGTVSIRQMVKLASQHSDTWLNELIWREFYIMILYNFPHAAHSAFKPAYEQIEWRNNENEFERWCQGQTGYPLVDAGMRQLNTTGFMHNRLRMITASFLVKHLLIDWRWGEAYFARKLLDFEQASNNGGWQWAASSGCDAAPYFRVFNPTLQQQRFDKSGIYIKQWVPEWGTEAYPKPIVIHEFARARVLEVYKKALRK